MLAVFWSVYLRVFILGAGFSHEAGYPLSRDLFGRLRENQLEMEKLWKNPPRPWQDFALWWNDQSSWLALFFPKFPTMENVDLELLLTVMDLRLNAIESITEKNYQQWLLRTTLVKPHIFAYIQVGA